MCVGFCIFIFKPDLLASVNTVGFFVVVVVEKLWLNTFFKRCLMINAAR